MKAIVLKQIKEKMNILINNRLQDLKEAQKRKLEDKECWLKLQRGVSELENLQKEINELNTKTWDKIKQPDVIRNF